MADANSSSLASSSPASSSRAWTLQRGDFDAVTFDVYGTILDWEPEIAHFFESWAAESGLTLSRSDILAAYDRLRQPLQNIRPALAYPEVLRRTFDDMAAHFGGPAYAEARDTFGRIAGTHATFPDSKPALDRLRASGLVLGALSNIDEASFETATSAADIRFDIVVTAERVGAYKPDHAHFQAALSDLGERGIDRQRVLHVAQSRRADVVPCNALGITCVWVDRPGHSFGRTGAGAEDARPAAVVASLAEAADKLGV